jgi:hypothetical protein
MKSIEGPARFASHCAPLKPRRAAPDQRRYLKNRDVAKSEFTVKAKHPEEPQGRQHMSILSKAKANRHPEVFVFKRDIAELS